MYRDYRNKDVQFFYVYKNLAHPEVNNFVPVVSIEERLLHIKRAKEMMKTDMNWICDTMKNDVKDRFGGTYNGEFIIDPDGKLLKKRFWSDPVQLRKDLVEIIGPVDKVTEVADLPTVFTPEPRKIASNVMPRPIMPPRLMPMDAKPHKSDDPFFAKLRIEANSEFYRGAKGKIFFTVYLDPIHKVHWNNLAGKVKLEIDAKEDEFEFSKTKFESLDAKVDADVDPRWMLCSAQAMNTKPFNVKLTYTICDDAETFCKEVVQEYVVNPAPNRNGGTRPGIFLNEMFVDVKKMDKNGDQKLTKDELPMGEVTMYVGHLDYDGDEVIDFAEIDRFMSMFNNGKGITETNDGG
ncbi:MAG: hypothetical protein AAFN77_12085 [Planctomycetota bacterium]